MGCVWKAQQVEWGAPVAVKLIDVSSSHEAAARLNGSPLFQRFLTEARAAASIRSPHVVQIIDHGMDQEVGLPFIVMELLEGETLEDRLAREKRLSPQLTAEILTQVARALTRVHEAHIVHRDLKPSNVFLVANDGDVMAKVLDFGIAKTRTDALTAPTTATGQQMGTPFYMSPEQIRGQRAVDFRADIWAFGVIAFECLTGKRPFSGETLGDLSLRICAEPLPIPSRVANVPVGFDSWFLRCVDRKRQLTFPSAKAAAEALRAALDTPIDSRAPESAPFRSPSGHPLAATATPVSSHPYWEDTRRKRPTAWYVGGALVGVGALALAFLPSQLAQPSPPAGSTTLAITTALESPAPQNPAPPQNDAPAAPSIIPLPVMPAASEAATENQASDAHREQASPAAASKKPAAAPQRRPSHPARPVNPETAPAAPAPEAATTPAAKSISPRDLIESRL